MSKVWTQPEVNQLRSLADQGMTDTAISRIIGRSPGAIWAMRGKHNIDSGTGRGKAKPVIRSLSRGVMDEDVMRAACEAHLADLRRYPPIHRQNWGN